MRKFLRAGILITLGMLIVCIIAGCGDDEYGEIKLVTTLPRDGGTLSAKGELLMIFDGLPKSVTVDGKRATVHADNTAIVQGADLINARTAPKKTFTISWTNLDNSFVGTETVTFDILKSPITVEVDPPPRSTDGIIYYTSPNTKFTLTFNEGVIAVTVNDTPASGSGLNWTWSAQPVLPYGFVTLKIKWTNRDGSGSFATRGPYKVADVDPVPPEITSGTVSDGDVDVDPARINAGGLRFDFDEPVTGTIKLTDEAGADLNWIGTVAGQTATLTAVAGQEMVNETTYKIEIDVRDGADLPLQATITFVTKPK